jgi:prepilin-type N-terminal cleavage/methylation domain-containing protein
VESTSQADSMKLAQTVERENAFTLIEVLVTLAIVALLAALLLPSLGPARERGRTMQCLSNERQIGVGMKLFADDAQGLYPESGADIAWDLIDNKTHKVSWMQQIFSNIKNRTIYRCPSDRFSPYSYFNGARAAYLVSSNFAALDSKQVRFPAAHVLSGDAPWAGSYATNDADKDDYSYNCVGGPTNGVPAKEWQAHNRGQNILFEDGHAKWYGAYNSADMTFRYESMHPWQ